MSVSARVSITLALVCAGIGAGIYLDRSILQNAPLPLLATDVSVKGTHYQFINPILFCQDQNISGVANSTGNQIQAALTDYIQSQKDVGVIDDAAVYFRDLGDGPWALINPDFSSTPASLLKIPTAISVYRRAERDPKFLISRVTFSSGTDANSSQYFKPADHVETGKTYIVEDLVRYMLQDSDNNALLMLGSTMDANDLLNTYNDLGVPPPDTTSGYTIGVRTFASFLRVLYNASYLSQEDSEHVLSLLSQSSFPQGLEAGVPKNITVAHKFGEHDAGNGHKQLSDCGIVYRPHDPYILCVMTQGHDFDQLATVISTVSNKVWSTLQSPN